MTDDFKPSVIFYWLEKPTPHFAVTKRVFYSDEDCGEWYKMNRWRVDGLSIIVPLEEKDAALKRMKEGEVTC